MHAQHKYTVAYNLHTFVNSINSTWRRTLITPTPCAYM